MYLRRNDADKLLKTKLNELFAAIDEQKGFLSALHSGDDWSLVIKAQALVEGAITQAILSHIGDQRLLRIVEAMPLIGDEVSKLALTKDLDILTSPQRRFVKKMASIRNRLAHRTDQVSFSFDSHISELTKDQLKDWQASVPWFAESADSKQSWASILIKAPKAVVHLSTFMLVASLSAEGMQKEMTRKIDELALSTTSQLLAGLSD